MGDLESQGVIRRMKLNEHLKFCAPAELVPKKSEKLCFVIDFTALNKYVNRPMHAFPSSNDIARSLKANTSHIGCIGLQTSSYVIATGKCMGGPIDVFIKAVKSMTKRSFPLF